MMASVRPKGIVFVSYAHADRVRVGALVEQLKPRFNVFWDAGLRPGDQWREVLADRLREARCVLGLWTEHLDDRSFFLRTEIDVRQAYLPDGVARAHVEGTV